MEARGVSEPKSDRRRDARSPLVLKVVVEGGDAVPLHTGDVSAGGAFVLSEDPPAVGSEISVELSFPGLLLPRRIRARVAWRRLGPSTGEDDEPGFGLEWLDVADDDPLRAALASDVARPPAPARLRFRVLVADDNPHLRKILGRGLERPRSGDAVDFEIVEAMDGREAIARLEEGGFDLLILDMYMPVLDGRDVLTRIRERPESATLPVVVVSAGGPEAREAALSAGADFFLPKPLRLVDVLETVRALLRLSS